MRKTPFRIALYSFLVYAGCALGQDSYKSGFIVTLANDTIYGLVRDQNWKESPTNIFFKAGKEVEARPYSVAEIKGFSVNSEFYVADTVEIELSPIQLDLLDRSAHLNTHREAFFVSILFEGDKSLYSVVRRGKLNLYIRRENELELLRYKKYKADYGYTVSVYSMLRENKEYLGQLAAYLKDCENIQDKLKGLKYTERSLMKLFDYYFTCSGSSVRKKRVEQSTKVVLSALAGLTYTNINISGQGKYTYFQYSSFKGSVNPSIGIGLEVILPRIHQSWSIKNELMFTNHIVNGSGVRTFSEDHYEKYDSEIGAAQIRLINMLAHSRILSNHDVKLTVAGGVTNAFSITETNRLVQFSKTFSTERTTYGTAVDDMKTHDIGVAGRVGVTFKRLSFELTAEFTRGFSPYPGLTSPTTRFYSIIGYRFTK